ncbi:MAG: terpene synthase family protein, partial [Myxococcales bacterium]|nr:terpene synthase family protein [Myxococcales bacterium]
VARDGGLQEVASYLTALERRTERLATHPLAMVLADLSCELLSSVPDTSFARRWRQAHHRYWLLGVLEEGRPATQALQPCLVRKPAVTAVEIYFELAEVATGARLSLEAHDATEMNELRVLGALIDGLFNDALSFERERERRMHSNIVICLCDECAMREEHALRRTIALHNDLVMDFDVLAQALLGGHPAQASELGPYLQAMRHLLVGLAEWQVYSRRYRSCLPVKIVVNGPDVYHPICRAGSFDEATLAEEITRRLKSERAATGAS